MQELLRNQVVAQRTEAHPDSHKAAEEAVMRLRRLRSPAHAPAPAAGGSRQASVPRRPRRFLLPVLAGAGGILAILASAFLLPFPAIVAPAGEPALGSGIVLPNRDQDRSYQVREGDTLGEIAELHGVDFDILARYNNLSNPDQLIAGSRLSIPSLENERALKNRAAFQPVALKSRPVNSGAGTPQLLIRADRQYDGTALTAHFSVDAPADRQFTSYEWDLGNGKRAYRENPYWSYEQPGTYAVKLHARLKGGAAQVSNTLYIDVPHPGSFQGGNQRFITLGNLQDSFRLDGEITAVNGLADIESAPISKVGQDGSAGIYQVTRPGYYAISLDGPDGAGTVYLFASPIPSVHVDRADMNWYRTQFNTGTLSNCGPSTVSMAYAWAKGGYLPVSAVRQAVGWRGNGSTSFEELTRVLDANDVANQEVNIRKAADLFSLVDRGSIAVILINTGDIRRSSGGLADSFGRYYSDVVGHYVVLKGYSLDHKYLIIQDPIPSDWSGNSFRQPDGISMSGRNRYYATEDVLRSLRTSSILEISR